MKTLEFFFDCSSPWTYLAFTRVQPIARRHEVAITWRPILVGGVFNQVNQSVYERREKVFADPGRARLYHKDMKDWADYCGLRIGHPPFHPVNSVKAMRGCLVAEQQGRLVPYAKRVFEAYWRDLQDISQDEVLAVIVQDVGLDADDYFRCINDQDYKNRLRANTDELIERGGYGSPTLFIDGHDMYFGNDRLELVDWTLGGRKPVTR